MSLFASFLLLLLILVEAAPPTASSVPLLGIYYCFNMVIIMLSIFLSSVVINISRRGDAMQQVPQWLRVISVEGLSKIFCADSRARSQRNNESIAQMRRATITTSQGTRHGDAENRSSTIITNEGVVAIPRHELDHEQSQPLTANGGLNVQNSTSGSSTISEAALLDKAQTALFNSHNALINRHFNQMQRSLKSLEATSKAILETVREKDHTRTIRQLRLEWQMVAMTLDRLFFILFVIAIVLSLVTLFPRPYM